MTNDDGTEYEISIVRKGGHYSRTVNGSEEELSGPVAVDSLWSKDRLTAGKLFSAASDEVYRVRSDLMGTETRSEEHTSELQSLMRISYAVVCLKKTTITIIQQLQEEKNKKETK